MSDTQTSASGAGNMLPQCEVEFRHIRTSQATILRAVEALSSKMTNGFSDRVTRMEASMASVRVVGYALLVAIVGLAVRLLFGGLGA